MVNSFASSVTARNTVVVHRRLSRNHQVELVETNRRGHATRFAHDAARRGVDVVVGFGGDGTLNEVATGIAGTDTALGALPGGSTNVFKYSDSEIDQLLDKARTTLDQASRKTMYDQVQKKLACTGPIAHLTYGTLFSAARGNLDGYDIMANRSLGTLRDASLK